MTPAEMADIDAEAPEPFEELIDRAAWAVAVNATAMLDHSPYGKRVAVVAGRGNNGEDGRRAVPHLRRRGAHCTVFDIGLPDQQENGAGRSGIRPGHFDLVIDACFGTGLSRDFDPSTLPISIGSSPVLAVDIPSGIDGLTGLVRGGAITATTTVTFAAHKPGLLLGRGPEFAGHVVVADIGLDCGRASMDLVGPVDVMARWPRRKPTAHKWRSAVRVIGGSAGMNGAPSLAATAALRAGAGYVAQSVPAGPADDRTPLGPVEVVHQPIEPRWGRAVAEDVHRFRAVVIGPGLPPAQAGEVADYLAVTETPTIIDAGGLHGVALLAEQGRTSGRLHVVTPHEGEFALLTGAKPPGDRVGAVRALARRLRAVVLLKGRTTVVADPDGAVLLSTAGDQRLATAGTGDVLAGIIGAGLAGGLDPLSAAGLGAEVHALAARRCRPFGLVAGDLPPAVADLLSQRHRGN